MKKLEVVKLEFEYSGTNTLTTLTCVDTDGDWQGQVKLLDTFKLDDFNFYVKNIKTSGSSTKYKLVQPYNDRIFKNFYEEIKKSDDTVERYVGYIVDEV